jgi:hypothetical protein
VLAVAGGAVLVRERAGAGAGGQCAEGPLVDGVVEASTRRPPIRRNSRVTGRLRHREVAVARVQVTG